MNLTSKQYATLWTEMMSEVSGQPFSEANVRTMEAHMIAVPANGQKEITSGIVRMLLEMDLLPLERWTRLNSVLIKNGLPGLDALTSHFGEEQGKILPGILARGSIRTEEELGVVLDELKDMTSDLTDEQRKALGDMINKFEAE